MEECLERFKMDAFSGPTCTFEDTKPPPRASSPAAADLGMISPVLGAHPASSGRRRRRRPEPHRWPQLESLVPTFFGFGAYPAGAPSDRPRSRDLLPFATTATTTMAFCCPTTSTGREAEPRHRHKLPGFGAHPAPSPSGAQEREGRVRMGLHFYE